MILLRMLTLKYFTQQTLIQSIVKEDCGCLNEEYKWLSLIQLLDQGSWGDESKKILDKLVQIYGHKVTSKIVEALAPSSARNLSLKACPLVAADCVNNIISRCQQMHTLDLSENPNLNFGNITLFQVHSGLPCQELSAVDLEDCPQITDSDIQALLKNAVNLQILNIAHCGITDKVFLLNEAKQLAREACFKLPQMADEYDCKLQTVNVSRCKSFTSTGVRHLCTLCGPTLQSLNISWTKVDCTSLLYLCGLGLPAVVEFFVSFNFLEKPLSKSLMATLQEFDDICTHWIHNVHTDTTTGYTTTDVEISQDFLLKLNTTEKLTAQSTETNVTTEKLTALSTETDVTTEKLTAQSTETDVTTEKLTALNTETDVTTEKLTALNTETDVTTEKLTALNAETNCNSSFYVDEKVSKNLPLQNSNVSHQVFHNSRACWTHKGGATDQSIKTPGTDTGEKLGERREIRSEAGFVGALIANKREQPTACLKHLKHQHVPFYHPNISSLYINGSVFEDEQLGLKCLSQFLTANPNVSALSLLGGVMCNLVSDSALHVIGAHGAHVVSISLEGCDHLTSAGITSLVGCRQLSDLDFTGLAFNDDYSIMSFAHTRPLTRLLLAENKITSLSLNAVASGPEAKLLKDLDLSWCEDMEDDEGLNNVLETCTNLERLILRDCSLSAKTLHVLFKNCHHIRELSLSSNMNAVLDAAVILLSENLHHLEVVDLSWNTDLTDLSIAELMKNCQCLKTANLDGLKRITSAPFLKIIEVSEELHTFITNLASTHDFLGNHGTNNTCTEHYVKLSDLPCLPHRSMIYCSKLQNLHLKYSDFVEDSHLQEIVGVSQGSIKVIDYYGEEVEETSSSIERFVNNLIRARSKQMQAM
ncbi:uncharacterized protein LOC131940922 [Physella acuta]|uniref:uncharacterized protein LOC131940922 n=1 Tax=Physella acuta TaxID=109671 RepID=UPI0027DE2BF1|nr:uncharacterized protein LOC131940922 [Physella acuta]